MKKLDFRRWLLALALTASTSVGSVLATDDDDDETTVHVVVVQSDGDDKDDPILEKVKAKLEKSGIPEAKREAILNLLRESLAGVKAKRGNIAEVHKQLTARLKTKKGGGTDKDQGKEEEMNVIVLNNELSELPGHLHTKILGQLGQGQYRIGISPKTDDDDRSDIRGIRIGRVMEDSPAAKAGVKEGDVLVTVNGEPADFAKLVPMVQQAGKDSKELVLKLSREGKEIKVEVTPSKVDVSDKAIDALRLTDPSHAFVVGGEHGLTIDGKVLTDFGPMVGMAKGFSFSTDGMKDLKKELEELKGQISELKGMIKELAGKQGK